MSIRNTLLFLICLAVGSSLQAAPFAYISNCCNNPSYMSLISTATNTQTGTIQTGTGGYGVVISPDNSLAYVTNSVSESITVIQISTKTVINTFPIGYAVKWIAISHDGSKLYVTTADSASSGHIIGVNAKTGIPFATFAAAGIPTQLAPTPDGTKLFAGISSTGGSTQYGVIELDPNSLALTNFLGGEWGVGGMAVTPDSSTLYVSNLSNSGTPTPQVTVYNTSTLAQIANLTLAAGTIPGTVTVNSAGSTVYVTEGGTTPGVAVIAVTGNTLTTQVLTGGLVPVQVAASTDGMKFYVTTNTGSSILSFNATNFLQLGTINQPGSLNGIALTGDNLTIMAPNYGSSQVAVVDTATGAIVNRIPVGDMNSKNADLAGSVVLNPTEPYVFVTNYESNNVSVISTATRQVVANVPVGPRPIALAVMPSGNEFFVLNSGNNTISVVSTSSYTVTATITPTIKTGYVVTSMALDPLGAKLYVATSAGTLSSAGVAPQAEAPTAESKALARAKLTSAIYIISGSNYGLLGVISVTNPISLAIMPTGGGAYDLLAMALGSSFESLTPINPVTKTIITAGVIPTNLGPPVTNLTNSIAVTTGGNIVFASYSNSVFSFNQSAKTFTTLGSGGAPAQLALTPDGTELWVANSASTSASEFSAANGSPLNTVVIGSNSYGVAISSK